MTAKEPLLFEQKHQLLVSLVCRATLQLDEMEHQMPSFRMNSLCSAWRGNALPSAASFCIQYGGLTKSISGRHRAARAKPTSASGLRTAAHGRFECDGLIFAFFGFATACSALEGQLDMGQRPALQCGAVGTCCLRGPDVHQKHVPSLSAWQTMSPILVQLRALGVRGQDKEWFVLAADLFNIRSICSVNKFAHLPSPN